MSRKRNKRNTASSPPPPPHTSQSLIVSDTSSPESWKAAASTDPDTAEHAAAISTQMNTDSPTTCDFIHSVFSQFCFCCCVTMSASAITFLATFMLVLTTIVSERIKMGPMAKVCVANLMMYEPFPGAHHITLPQPYISREVMFAAQLERGSRLFQYWYGPSKSGKSTKARNLARTERANGNPVLYLSYNDDIGSGFEAIAACVNDSLVLPGLWSWERHVTLLNAVQMFRNEGYVWSGISRWWHDLFVADSLPYAGDGLPLVIVDHMQFAPNEEVERWTWLGHAGMRSGMFRTVLISNIPPILTNTRATYELRKASQISFLDFNWSEAQELLRGLGIVDYHTHCDIWRVTGGQPEQLVAAAEMLNVSTYNATEWRATLVREAGVTYISTLKRLPTTLQDGVPNACTVLARLLDGSPPGSCIDFLDFEAACIAGDDDAAAKADRFMYFFQVVDELIITGNVFRLHSTGPGGSCIGFATKAMQDFATSMLAKLPLPELSTVQCPPPS